MYLLIAADGELSLRDSDNMRVFSIVEDVAGMAASKLAAIAVAATDDHYWLDAEAIIDLSGRRDDQRWIDAFWEMLAKVEAYGYSNLSKKQVKAHVEQRV